MIRRLHLVLSLLTTLLPAQVDRFELGLRLRAFERNLEQVTDEARRDAAFVQLDRAVQAFFRFDAAASTAAIDAADEALLGAPPDASRRFARSLGLALHARLVAAGDGTAAFTIAPTYRDAEAKGDGLVLFVQSLTDGGAPLRVALDELPATAELPLAKVPEGDHVVRWWVARGDEVLVRREHGLSVVQDVDARLSGLFNTVSTSGRFRELTYSTLETEPTIEQVTVPAIVTMLRRMRSKSAEETILKGHRLLVEAETIVSSDDRFYGPDRAGDFWLRVPLPTGKTASVRLLVPPRREHLDRVPLVIAVHGAGGSENLFFDGYGDGKVVRLAAERGWFVCAPRSTFGGVDAAALADALAARWPIDRQRVLLVGHSMGAMNVITNATRAPQAFAAVAALGGGGMVPRRAAYAKLPFFVGAGSRDFALDQAQKLDRDLRAVSANCTLREYPGVEHLAIVQIALPDVFAFFERALTSPK